MKTKIKFLFVVALFCFGLIIPSLGEAGCTTTTYPDGGIQTVCDDGTVTSHSTLQPNGGCAGMAEDCHSIIIME